MDNEISASYVLGLKKLSLPLAFCLFTELALGQEYDIVPLPIHRSISTLLFERGQGPLYGPNGLLNEVLELNGLTEKTARRLRPNHPLKLPKLRGVETLETPPEGDEIEKKDASSTWSKELQAHVGYYVYRSNSENGSTFSAFGPLAEVSFRLHHSAGPWVLSLAPNIQAFHVSKVEDTFQYNAGISLSAKYGLSSWRFGGGATYSSLFYILAGEATPATKRFEVPGLFLSAEKKWQTASLEAIVGANLPASDSDLRIKTSPIARILATRDLKKDLRLTGNLSMESRTIEDDDQIFMSVAVGVEKNF